MYMGGSSLHMTLTLSTLCTYLDAFADFLINYRPFMYQARGSTIVGVHLRSIFGSSVFLYMSTLTPP